MLIITVKFYPIFYLNTFIDLSSFFFLHFQTSIFFFSSLLNKPVHNITSFKNKKIVFLLVFFSLFLFFFCDKEHSCRKQIIRFYFIISCCLWKFKWTKRLLLIIKRKIEEILYFILIKIHLILLLFLLNYVTIVQFLAKKIEKNKTYEIIQ
jgi:hypothetical protein